MASQVVSELGLYCWSGCLLVSEACAINQVVC